MNVTHDADRFYVRADLPGVKPEDIDIRVENDRLTIAGKRTASRGGAFSRTFALPQPFDGDRIEAKLELGVLTVIVPKSAQAKPKKIVVKGGAS